MSAFSLLISPGVVTKNLPRLTERPATDTWFPDSHLIQYKSGVNPGKVSSLRWITWALIHFRCHGARPVSYYAFFKGWLLPSPPPGCHRSITSFSTKWLLRDLSVRSGLFPSRLWILAPKKSVCTNDLGLYSEFPWGYSPHWVLYLGPKKRHHTLYWNRFRGKPAISDLGWPFTPSHKSSPYFATYVGSVLQGLLELSSTCSWLDRSVSGQIGRTHLEHLTSGKRLHLMA